MGKLDPAKREEPKEFFLSEILSAVTPRLPAFQPKDGESGEFLICPRERNAAAERGTERGAETPTLTSTDLASSGLDRQTSAPKRPRYLRTPERLHPSVVQGLRDCFDEHLGSAPDFDRVVSSLGASPSSLPKALGPLLIVELSKSLHQLRRTSFYEDCLAALRTPGQTFSFSTEC